MQFSPSQCSRMLTYGLRESMQQVIKFRSPWESEMRRLKPRSCHCTLQLTSATAIMTLSVTICAHDSWAFMVRPM